MSLLIFLLLGGGQESGCRSGTEAAPVIAGFAAACAKGPAAMRSPPWGCRKV